MIYFAFVLLQRIKAHLKTFSEGYGHHSLRTEKNELSLQLRTYGSITYQPHSDRENVRAYGIDWDEPVNLTHISVPDITNPLEDEMLPLFSACLDPLKESDTFGVHKRFSSLLIFLKVSSGKLFVLSALLFADKIAYYKSWKKLLISLRKLV